MGLRLNLGRYLERRNLSAYRVVKETTGRLAPGTVYALARKPARKVDLETVGEVLGALERITGEPVTVADLLEIAAEPARTELEAAELARLAAFRDAAASEVVGRLAELEASQPPEERRAWLEAAQAVGVPARYVPGRGFLADGEA